MVLADYYPNPNETTSRLSLAPLIDHAGFQDAEKKCQLLGPVALVVQGCMGVFVVLSLVVKRQFEGNVKRGIPKRRWRVWSMDVGKQLIGQGFVHFLNVWISAGIASHEGDINPCSLYFLNVLVDTTIGVLFLYLALKGFTWTCEKLFGRDHGFRSGIYGEPPSYKPFLLQLAIYLVSLTLMKLAVILLFYLCAENVLLPFAGVLIGWMGEDTQVVVVMAVFPLIMNVLQFCLVDQLIKGGAHPNEDGPSVTVTIPRKDSGDASEHDEDDDDRIEDGSLRISTHSHLRPTSEEGDRNLLAHPSSPSSSARAPLLTSVSRRASPFSSPKNQSLVLSVVLAILFMLPGVVMASSGDRLPAYQGCVQSCVLDRCKSDPPVQLGFALDALRWTCPEDCAYQCTHTVTDHLESLIRLESDSNSDATGTTERRMHQFHGKWPFWRIAGIQEPASVLFSLGNAWVHYVGWRKVKTRVRDGMGVGLKGWIQVLAVVQMNTWVWSAVFHTRDTPFTEKMDYFSATATIMCTLFYTLIRTFHLFPQTPHRPRGHPAMYLVMLVFTLAYVMHLSYLLSTPRFDYGWNVLFNLIMGSTHLILWSLFSLSFSCRLPWPLSMIPTPYPPLDPLTITPKPPWSGRSALLVMATTAAMSLELVDFPPLWRTVDAHSLWHLATIFIARGWYGFLIRDVAMLEAVRSGLGGHKAVDWADGTARS